MGMVMEGSCRHREQRISVFHMAELGEKGNKRATLMCSCSLFLPLPQDHAPNSYPQEPRGSGYGIPRELFGENMVIGRLQSVNCPLPAARQSMEGRGEERGPCTNCQDVANQLGDGADGGRHTEELIIDWLRRMETVVLGAQESVCLFLNHSGAYVRVPLAQSLGVLLPAPN